MRTLTVLGGSSVSTPLLIEAIGRGVASGALPPVAVRLWGRAAGRMGGVASHGLWRLRDVPGARVTVDTHTDLAAALDGADAVLGQVRVGGFSGRSTDEAFALAEGLPGDEGLGPSGLSCYLRGRATLDGLADGIARHAPQAVYLQLTSPLGLTVARAIRAQGLRCYGVCELLGNTARKVAAAVGPRLGVSAFTVRYGGLNHQNWIHVFQDASGIDRTADVLGALDDPSLVQVDPARIRQEGAVPVPYLRLYYHTAAVVRSQQARTRTRGEELDAWAGELEAAYGAGPDLEAAARLLAQRHINWYEEGVVPALQGFLGQAPVEIALNGLFPGMLPGAPDDAVVEVPCQVQAGVVTPIPVPPLPPGPADLTRRLIRYEAAVLDLPERPDADALSAALVLHPLVPDAEVAARLGARLAGALRSGG